ncbi:MAG TPA: TadE/TadG family type IV pilus assembly protein [Caulobacteraceae bacterium]|jgi:Flp pilus assembly protein TadG
MDCHGLTRRPLRAGRLRRIGFVVFDESGSTAVEFALLLPMLCLLMFAVIKFGIVFNNYVQLTNAAAAGSRYVAISRGWNSTSTSLGPYSGAIDAAQKAAPNLGSTTLKNGAVVYVNGTQCGSITTGNSASDTACAALLAPLDSNGNATTAAVGQPAKISLTYPCDLAIFISVFPNCTLNASASGAVQ